MEGSDIFQYQLEIGDDEGQQDFFYSRRIGRTTQFERDLTDEDVFADIPQNITIKAGTKINLLSKYMK